MRLLAIIGPAGTDVSGIAKNFKTKGSSSEAPKEEGQNKKLLNY